MLIVLLTQSGRYDSLLSDGTHTATVFFGENMRGNQNGEQDGGGAGGGSWYTGVAITTGLAFVAYKMVTSTFDYIGKDTR